MMDNTANLLRKLFMMKKRLQDLEEKKAPHSIIGDLQSSFRTVLYKLLLKGIDGEKYLESPKGMAEYVIYCSEEEQLDNISARCGRCSYYFFKETTDGCKKEIFSDSIPKPILCDQYNDCGHDFPIRLQICISKCFSCKLFNKDIEHGGGCSENHDIIDLNCKFWKVK